MNQKVDRISEQLSFYTIPPKGIASLNGGLIFTKGILQWEVKHKIKHVFHFHLIGNPNSMVFVYHHFGIVRD